MRYAHVQWATFPGSLRSKLTTPPRRWPPARRASTARCWPRTHGDGNPAGDVLFDAPVSNMANGYPNVLSFPDPATVVRLPWRPETAAVLLNR